MQVFRTAMRRKTVSNREDRTVAWVGVDWADERHEVSEYTVASGATCSYSVEHSAESLQEWIATLRERYAEGPVAVVLEQARGGLIYALMSAEFIEIYPINPQSLAKYRAAMYPSGAKSDPRDAELQQQMVRQNPGRFRVWRAGDEQTRSLQLLVEGRRKLVDDMTGLTNQLTSALKTYYPQALEWAGELSSEQASAFLKKWPTLTDLKKVRAFRIREFYQNYGRPKREVLDQRVRQIQQARPLTSDPAVVMAGVMMVEALIGQIGPMQLAIGNYDKQIERLFQSHPDRAVFESLPGAGKVLAPRLLAAFGADRDRFEQATEIQALSGTAPVTARSGKTLWVHRRWACSKFLLQTFHEFADQSRKFCDWAKQYYQQQRKRGNGHHAAVRALAYKWIRIIFRCWKERQPYDNARYLEALSKRGSELAHGPFNGAMQARA
jgi:transposase